MNIPKRASRHHAMRASFCAAVSTTARCAASRAVAVVARSSARTIERKRTGVSGAGVNVRAWRVEEHDSPAVTKLHGGEATVDGKRDAGDERRFVGHEPERGVGALLGRAEPAHR